MKIPSTSLSSNIASNASNQSQLEQIATGKRVNSAKDDAAGLAIINRLDSDVSSTRSAMKNTLDGLSRLEVEDGALASVTEELQRVRELKVRQVNGSLGESDRDAIQQEIDQRMAVIESQFSSTEFNGSNVFQGQEETLQIGINADQTLTIEGATEEGLLDGLNGEASLESLDSALVAVAQRRSTIGALSNRLDSNASNLASSDVINQQTRSRIEDADIAKTVSESIALDVKRQVSIAVQGQANAQTERLLGLLK